MSIRVHVLPVIEMAVPLTGVYQNIGPHAAKLRDMPNVRSVHWGDGGVSEGITHCGVICCIEGAEKRILVDTGAGDVNAINAYRLQKGDHFFVRELDTVEHQLAKIGVGLDDIDVVINTHLHWDHVGGNHMFQHAEFYLPFLDIPYAMTALPWAPHFYPSVRENVIACSQGAHMVRGSEKVCDGVYIQHLGGHSEGSQGVFVRTDAGVVALAGDVVTKYANIEENWPGPSGNIWNTTELMEAYAYIRMHADIVVPFHDWQLFDRHKDGIIG